MNRSVGGLNPAAVEQMAAIGQGAGSIELGGLKSADYARAIRAVGADRMILSTDAGAQTQPLPPDAMVQFILQMRSEGISNSELDLMTTTNPAVLLGLGTN